MKERKFKSDCAMFGSLIQPSKHVEDRPTRNMWLVVNCMSDDIELHTTSSDERGDRYVLRIHKGKIRDEEYMLYELKYTKAWQIVAFFFNGNELVGFIKEVRI